MVASAGSAGASSSMKIVGTMDTSNVDRGFQRVGQGFEGVKGKGKSFGADMKRVAQTVSGLAKKLALMGIAGGTAMVGLASKAPAVAPALAKMGVSMGKIQRSLGEALAPAFEKVAGWLDKLAVWVDNNKDKIGELADKFLDWGSAMAEKVWPVLKDIGNWAADHPGLFTGIVAGLILAPAAIAGIASISSMVAVLGGATLSASLLAGLGYIVAIGAVSYAAYKGAELLVDKAQGYTGMTGDGLVNGGTDMSGQTLATRLPQKIWSDITGNPAPWEDVMNPNSPANQDFMAGLKSDARANNGSAFGGGTYEADTRRRWFLQLWDSVWG